MPNLTQSIVPGDIRPDLLQRESLAGIFRHTAATYGSYPALTFNDAVLTYAQLDQWSDAVAAFLAAQGIGRGSYVGLWWPRGLELHAAILGITKSGAAYVPLDREMPAERVEVVLNEVGASACFSDGQLTLNCPVLAVPPQPQMGQTFAVPEEPQPEDNAYVLYTSGSTGTPKGIAISQQNICHLVRSEQAVIGVKHEDRVYQGFSVSFDMWCEEVWISYLVGASLFVADATTAKSIDELDQVLNKYKITILHAVPSLLAVIDDNIPTLRMVNAGGEACTPQVLLRWAKPSRVFYNSYGPTETTVTSTMIALKPGDPITIGAPLPNYNLAVVDETFNLLPAGERGELVITGPGLSTGYINRPDLTAQKFVTKPQSLHMLPGDRMYRTGDAAIINPDSTVDFQGRLDDQIKLRGYRIELGEIEVRLNQLPGIAAAAVAVKKDGNDQDTLVGYAVLQDEVHFDEAELRNALGKVLPTYMVPGNIVQLPEMPRLPSGKIDRKNLPVPACLLEVAPDAPEEALDPTAPLPHRVLHILDKVFPGRKIELSQDFFTDLGGHSLLAAMVVSRLRKEGGIGHASLKDIYTNRPLSALVGYWEAKAQQKKTEKKPFNKVPKARFYACFSAQTIALLVIYGLYAAQIFFPYLAYYYVQQDTDSHGYGILAALGMYCLMPPLLSVVCIAAKWLIIGKMREGDYPLWGTYYFRWWLVKNIQRITLTQFLNGTPLYNTFLRWLGVKVAPDAQLGSVTIGAEDLVTIGPDASLSSQVVLNNAWVEDGMLHLRRIHLGAHAYIGSSAVIGGDTVVEDWGELQDLSYLPQGQTIKKGEVWKGSPATLVHTMAEAEYTQPIPVSLLTRQRYRLWFSLLLLVFPVAVLLPLVPTIVTLNTIDTNTPGSYDFSYLVIAPLLAFAYILLFGLQTAVITRLLQWGIKPGRYPIYSNFYLRKWLADQFMSLSLIIMHPIYATVYVSTFFRALGAKVGKNTEISTASSVTHPLFCIGNGSFVADAATIGESDVRGQQLILDNTVIGSTSFIGNSALIPQGYTVPDNMLIGVLSTPPTPEQLQANEARDYFGSPAIPLPQRQESQSFSDKLTMYPKPARRAARSLVEFIRILIPETVIICLSVVFIAVSHDLVTASDIEFSNVFLHKFWNISQLHNLWLNHIIETPFIPRLIITLPFLYLIIIGIPAFLTTVILKWIFVGKYKAAQHPMWTWNVWRSEAITTTYEALAIPYFLEYLKGTPWLPAAMRLLGVKIGKRVWMNTADITEYDMVTIGDDTAMNDDCGPQTHLFEDRVMKVGTVNIGKECSIGARSIILYDSELGNGVTLDGLSLVMKGEKLQDDTIWTGSPVKGK